MKGSRIPQSVTVSPALRRLLLECQTLCTADCCKERAFEITDKRIAHWLERERVDRSLELGGEIRRIESDVRHATGHVFLAARGLESTWAAAEFKTFWANFMANYSRALQLIEGKPTFHPSARKEVDSPALRPYFP